MLPQLEPAELPADAIEVGRIHDAWGIKGWFKVLPHSASPEALFSSRRWFLQPSEKAVKPAFSGTVLLRIREAKEHADSIVATAQEVDDRNAAEALKGLIAHPDPVMRRHAARVLGDIGLAHFGASAPYQRIYEELGLTAERIVEAAEGLVRRRE